MASLAKFAAPVHLFRPISLKDVAGVVMQNWHASCKSAWGSASELEYQLLLAHDLNYLGDEIYTELHKKVTEIKRMLASFIKTLKK